MGEAVARTELAVGPARTAVDTGAAVPASRGEGGVTVRAAAVAGDGLGSRVAAGADGDAAGSEAGANTAAASGPRTGMTPDRIPRNTKHTSSSARENSLNFTGKPPFVCVDNYVYARRRENIPKICFCKGENIKMKVTYKTQGVCSRQMTVEAENGIIKSVQIVGGCNGNLKGITRLVEGMAVDEAISRLEGIQCGDKGTSCPDQLAQALKQLT